MAQQSISTPAIQQGITLSGYIKNWLKGMISAFKPKNLPFTLGITVISAVAGTLLTVFVFPGLFSLNPTVNAAYGGLAVSLTVTTVMNIVIGFLQKKSGYFAEIASVGRLWFEMFGKKISLKERIYAIVLSVLGLVLGCFFSHPFMLLLSVSMWFFAIAGEQGQVLMPIAALQNSFNGFFRPEYIRRPEATRRDLAALAVGMFVTAAVFTMIGGATA